MSKYVGTISVLLFLSPTSSQRQKQVVYTSWDSDALCPDSESNDDYRATYTTSGLILFRLDHMNALLSLLDPRLSLPGPPHKSSIPITASKRSSQGGGEIEN